MKLLSCHIEGFGLLSKIDYNFNRNISEYYYDNGYGKTTLAAFIRAMFYSFPTTRGKDFDERQHFYPFSGGKFGGSLEFEADGKNYRIERFFDKKSSSKDSVKLFENNEEINADEIGMRFFGLDEKAFLRTAFFRAEDMEIGADGNINAKLNNFVVGSSDIPFEKAVLRLEESQKHYKKKGGKLDAVAAEINRLKIDIANIESDYASLEGKYAERKSLIDEIGALEKKLNSETEEKLLSEKWKTYDAYTLGLKTEKENLELMVRAYPFGLPNASEVAELKSASGALINLTSRLSAQRTDVKRQRLATLNVILRDKISDEKLAEAQADIDTVKQLDVKLEAEKSDAENEKAAVYERKFPQAITDGEFELCDKCVEKLRKIDALNRARMAVSAEIKSNQINKNKIIPVLAAVAVLLICGGIALAFSNLIIGITAVVFGVLTAVLDASVYFKNKKEKSTDGAFDGESVISLQAEERLTTDELREFNVERGYSSKNGVIFDYEILKRDYAEYLTLASAIKENRNKYEKIKSERDEISERLNKFFEMTGINGGDYQERITLLIQYYGEYKSLLVEVNEAELIIKKIKSEIELNKNNIAKIFDKYKIICADNVSAQIAEICEKSAEMDKINANIERLSREENKYKTQNGLAMRPQNKQFDIEKISEELSDTRKRLAFLEQSINAVEDNCAPLGEKKNLLEKAEEALEEYKNKYKIISAALSCLLNADKVLNEKYVLPIQSRFIHYANMLETAMCGKITMEKDYKINFTDGGEKRSDKHLSAGQKALLVLCFRLALIDNMYEKEKPFVIMDDPFCTLDEGHMKNTAELIQKISDNIQIIYFTCHPSRKLLKK